MFRFSAGTVSVLSLVITSVIAAPLFNVTKRAYNFHKAIPGNFPDPSLFLYGSSDWWAFATTNHDGINVQVATSSDFSHWTVQTYDALPNPGSWTAATPNVWAPNVVFNNWGFYVMYYSAATASDPSKHCVGVAVASQIQGPYIPHDQPFACPMSKGGAIDASGFHDTDGTRYVVYKIDGGSIGHGGDCNNGASPVVPTPIMLQKVDVDAFTPIGSPVQIMTNLASDDSGVEAPALMRTEDGTYVLFFSSGCYTNSDYDIAYAMSTSVTGTYKRYGSFAITGTDGLTTPGGAHVNFDGRHMAFHADNGKGGRAMYTSRIYVDTKKHVVTANA